MRHLFVLVLIVVLLFGSALSSRAVADERTGPRTPFTQMEAGPFGRAHLVAVVDVQRVVEIAPRGDLRRGPQLVHGTLAQLFKVPSTGRPVAKGSDVTIRVSGPRPTLNADHPSQPYLKAHARGRFVFFATRRAGGHAFDMNAMFEADSDEGRQKTEALARIATLRRERNDDRRAQATLKWLLETQRGTSRWARVNGARELNYLVEKRADLFTETVRQVLRTLPSRKMPRDQRVWLGRLFTILGDRSGVKFDPTASTESAWAEAYRKALDEPTRKALLAKAMQDANAKPGPDAYADVLAVWDNARREAVRIEIVEHAANGAHTAWAKILRVRYANLESLAVREAIVRALGFIGTDSDVTWLQARLSNRALAQPVLLALARIRTPFALEALRGEHVRCANGTADDRTRGRWIAHLLSSSFVDDELAAGHAVGPRPTPTPSVR